MKNQCLKPAAPATGTKSDNSGLLAIIIRATRVVRQQSWRRRRDFSLALVKLLGDLPSAERVRKIAFQITGVEPVRWLTRSRSVTRA